MLKKILSLLLHKKHVYADATYNNGTAVIGYITSDLMECEYNIVSAKNANDAEMKAVEFAHAKYPLLKIATDSKYAVENTEGDYVFHVKREQNIANVIARSAKEMTASRVNHKF